MRTLLFTLMLLAGAAALASPVYKWVDENGVVHYSDQPHANAEKVQLGTLQTYRATQYNSNAPPVPDAAPATAAYTGCSIAQPADQADFANIESLNIVVQTAPGLRQGDQIFVMVDGSQVGGGPINGNSVVLNPVERGSHTAQAVIRDSGGQIMCQTPSVTFSVHKASIANPVNPVRPH
jgi:hypothetical protein